MAETNVVDKSYLIDLYHSKDFAKTKTGDLLQVSGRENLRQALWHRITTVPGTLAHRPLYGVGIQQYEGAFASITTQRAIALKVKEQLEQDSRVEEVTGIQLRQDEVNSSLFFLIVRIIPVGYNEVTEEFEL